jgi:hypothetical protein
MQSPPPPHSLAWISGTDGLVCSKNDHRGSIRLTDVQEPPKYFIRSRSVRTAGHFVDRRFVAGRRILVLEWPDRKSP